MDSIVGFPPDFANLESKFGLDTGKGEAFYNTVVNTKVNLDSTCAALNTVDLTV